MGPLGKTLSKAVSGGAKAVSNGGVRFLRGVDAFWNDFEKNNIEDHLNERDATASSSNNPNPSLFHQNNSHNASIHSNPSTSSTSSYIAETTTQQASRLFSNLSTFLSRKQKEFSQTIEVNE